jgi:coatomer subunit beta'
VRYACLCLIASRLTQQHRQVSECVDLLVETNRLPEAALFARSYCPSRIKDVLAAWKEDVGKANDKAARMLADPEEYANLFPELSFTKAAEAQIASGSSLPPASAYSKVVAEREVPLAERLSGGGGGGGGAAAAGGSGAGSRASSPRKEVDDADLELDDDDLGDGGDDDDDDAGGGDGDDDDKELDELLAAEDEDGEE